jgi:hypothetical protein
MTRLERIARNERWIMLSSVAFTTLTISAIVYVGAAIAFL